MRKFYFLKKIWDSNIDAGVFFYFSCHSLGRGGYQFPLQNSLLVASEAIVREKQMYLSCKGSGAHKVQKHSITIRTTTTKHSTQRRISLPFLERTQGAFHVPVRMIHGVVCRFYFF